MPIIVATAIRTLISIAVQLGLATLLEKYLLPLVNSAIEAIMEFFGVDEETAKDIMANQIIQFAESVAIYAGVWKTKIPVKVADRLGFTSKGFAPRKLPAEVESGVKGSSVSSQPSAAEAVSGAQTTAKAQTEARGFSWSSVGSFFNGSMKILNTTFLGFLVAANVLDFGNWNSGAYQHQIQRLFAWFGLEPDKEFAKSSVLSDDMWGKILATYQQLGAVGISDPFKDQSVLFTRQNLVDLVDKTAATIIQEQGKATFTDVFTATQAFIVMGGPVTDAKLDKVYGISTAQAAGAPAQPFTQINITDLPFGQIIVPPLVVDRITSADELKQAITSTIAQFSNQIPNRLSFEIQLVKFWVDPQGQYITPNPPAYIESTKSASGTTTKVVQNKIVILKVFFTTHENKRVPIYAWPLDYSVADSVITPAPSGASATIPVTIDVIKTIIAQPSAAPSQSTAVQGSPSQSATPAVITTPTPTPTPIPTPAPTPIAGGFNASVKTYTSQTTGFVIEIPELNAQGVSALVTNMNAAYLNGKITRLEWEEIRGRFNLNIAFPGGTPISVSAYPRTVTVNVDAVMVRAAPSSTAALAGSQRLVRGAQFKVVGSLTGENVSGENRWWKSEFGNYVWVGGTTEKP